MGGIQSILTVLMALAACCGARPTLAVPPQPAAVERLIEQLDADTLRERAAAERVLLELGPELLPLLPPPDRLPNVSSREAVRRIRLRLEHAQAVASVEASRVDVPAESTLGGLLARITEQSENAIDATALPESTLSRPVTLPAETRDFWPLLDDVAARMNIQFEPAPRSNALRLVPLEDDSAKRSVAVAYSGAFRIAVQTAESRPLFGNDAEELLRLRLSVLAEPRLRPLFLKFAAGDLRAASGETRLEPFNPQAQYELPVGEGGKRVEFQLDYRVPAGRRPAEIALHGTARMLTAAASERFTFDRLADQAGIARRRGGVTVKLGEVDFKGNAEKPTMLHVGLIVSYDTGGPAFESHRTWIFHNQAYLETADGRRIDREGNFGTRLQRDGGVAVDYDFTDLTEPLANYRFVYVAPTLLVDAPVDVDFPQVPLAGNKNP